MGNNPVMGFDPDGGWDIITTGIKWLGAAIRGENPSAITQRFDGEHGFYTSKRYDTGDGSIRVMGAANFDDNGTGYHVALNTINNAWRQSELYPFQDYNPLIGEWRWKQQRASGAIESLYIEEYFINPPSTVAKTGWTALSIAMKASAKRGARFAAGSFSVFNWKGYPEGGIKPTGPFRLLEGAEYTSARNLANSTNAAMRRAHPEMFKGLQIHEIHPVKFGGSPTDLSNKIFLTQSQHIQYTNFWNALMRSSK